ncbi:hypothetical protein [Streptomyces fuscichromogenes]|uniref:Uncharacterized protein n=1 Tax=Streptomyces fuscichromogenes TaxID=1324013 RepID=A0A917UKP6_9ACTN|nr:hypothetical protein [Streptomyces fuscichromogenes]GGM96355.1 hypothetical protein GCM10011578_016200 [Streptomyces fuscichromogenes]
MRIDINELEILEPDTPAGPDTHPAEDTSPARRPAADLGEQLRRWQRETLAREQRLLAD